VWWLWLACAHREPDPAVRAQALLDQVDAAWERRGEIGYDQAARPLLRAYGLAPKLPGVVWRLARWRFAEGLAAEDPRSAKSSFAEARATAIGCLQDSPGFVAGLTEGWSTALAAIPPERVPCAGWGAIAWARWYELQGPAAAAIDLDAIDSLAAVASASLDPEVHGLGAWAAGVVAATRPDWAGHDPGAARADLEEAVRADPDSLARQADLYRLVVAPTGSDEEVTALRERILARPPTNPEDQRARDLLTAP
jgi:hypothetical protein